MLAGPVGPLNCGIGTFSAAELEKGAACRRRHKWWASLLKAGGTGGSLCKCRWTDNILLHLVSVFMCAFPLKCVPWSFSAIRAPVVIRSTPYFQVVDFKIFPLLVAKPRSPINRLKSRFRKLIGDKVEWFWDGTVKQSVQIPGMLSAMTW